MQSVAKVGTELPRRYMIQLCKHFQHKIPVTIDEAATPPTGRIEFRIGVCELSAPEGTLVMRCTAGDAEQLGQLQDVVARHLERFAFRAPVTVDWVREAA